MSTIVVEQFGMVSLVNDKSSFGIFR